VDEWMRNESEVDVNAKPVAGPVPEFVKVSGRSIRLPIETSPKSKVVWLKARAGGNLPVPEAVRLVVCGIAPLS
jgi:hypothetical protein